MYKYFHLSQNLCVRKLCAMEFRECERNGKIKRECEKMGNEQQEIYSEKEIERECVRVFEKRFNIL